MSRDYQEQIAEILDNFDFDRVHRVMVAIDWRCAWCGLQETPTILAIHGEARRLLETVIGDTRIVSCSSGGLVATRNREGRLELSFVAVRCVSRLEPKPKQLSLWEPKE